MTEARLREVVRLALGDATAELGAWQLTTLQGGFGALAGASGVKLVSGVGWSLVAKELAPRLEQQESDGIYWKREALLYGSGALDDLPGIRAPRCYGADDLPDGGIRLWLEHVNEEGDRAWPLERWALAGRHLGRFNGAYLAGRPLPKAPWLNSVGLREWVARHERLLPRIEAAALDPRLKQWWPPTEVAALLRFWADRERFIAGLERLPRSFSHGDAIRRNLMSSRGPADEIETVAIDWEWGGYRALGEESGQMLSVAAAFHQLAPAQLPELDAKLFPAYIQGLRDAGATFDERQVRFAYTAHAALRNVFNAVAAMMPDTEERRASILASQGLSWEQLAEARAAIRPFLLGLAEEAGDLIE